MAGIKKLGKSVKTFKKGQKVQEDLNEFLKLLPSLPALRRRLPSVSRSKKELLVEIAYVQSPQMIQLNRKYFGKKSPTDILSFRSPEVFWNHGILGQLVVCVPVLKKQARDFGHSEAVEARILLVHGLLHLLGFDHEKSAKQAQVMRLWERRLLKAWFKDSKAGALSLIHRIG